MVGVLLIWIRMAKLKSGVSAMSSVKMTANTSELPNLIFLIV